MEKGDYFVCQWEYFIKISLKFPSSKWHASHSHWSTCKLLVVSIYRPLDQKLAYFLSCITDLLDHCLKIYEDFVVIGDFNESETSSEVDLFSNEQKCKNIIKNCRKVVEITKGTWEKCSIKTAMHYNEKEDIIELWQNVSDVETQIKHSNICDIALKELESIVAKKQKTLQKKKNKNTKHFLKTKKVFLLLKSLHVI